MDTGSLVDAVYEAAFLSDRWADVLDRLAKDVGAEGTILANISDPTAPWIASDGVAQLYECFFQGGWAYNNAKTMALLDNAHPGFISDALYLGEDWMAQQAVYRDFYWKHGFGYAAGTTIRIPSGDVIGISIEKKRELGPVVQQDLDRLDILRPHLARAALLGSQLQFARIEAALQALQLASLPAAMVRNNGTMIECNSLFHAFTGHIVFQPSDGLRFKSRAADTAYRSFLEAWRNRGGSISGASWPIKGSSDAAPAVAHLVPIKGAARDIFLRTAFFLIITPVHRSNLPSVEIIQGLFDLTPTEAKIGRKLAGGETIDSTARSFGISVETVRSHVKAILSKSGMSRQTDFVAAVATIMPIGERMDD
ncbi:LuxR family transcriptional regulator [Rhizobium deserti]|uniref:LuxR family transcriptional regulator n=1 Tax=Rhizobium deserti TaxID=2547961 RepID=A0A4R5U6T9_9HYPH|nr:helix-turn-helix transcriptional regulator [Rhizobium deserti]TDK29908.1 LuxR family transcriptional regulator [Rhizobium deserti]